MSQAYYAISYPERRMVSAAQITSWYVDAVANGEVNTGIHEGNPPESDVDVMAYLLDDVGIITLSNMGRGGAR